MTTAPRGPEEAERWLCAGLCLARLEGTSPEAVAQAVPWLLATHAELPALPPVGVVVDLGRLALGAPLESSRPVPDTVPSCGRRCVPMRTSCSRGWPPSRTWRRW
ncbi:hypothetical protein ACN28S_07250 [Cystobacter fuscus]